jgi:hypothetical protein
MGEHDAKSGVPLSFDAWAELSAGMVNLGKEQRIEMLEARNVEVGDWERSDQHHLQALAGDLARGDMTRLRRYGALCAAELKGRDTGGSPAQTPPSTPPPPVAAGTAEATPNAPPPEAAVPTFLQEAGPTPASSPAAPPRREPESLTGTALAFEIPSAFRVGALPFNPDAAPVLKPSAGEPKPARALDAPGETVPLGVAMGPGADKSEAFRPAIPFPAPSAPAFPRMPLATYAALCAELVVFPGRSAEVLAKYRITSETARTALEEHWLSRFAEHPGTKAEWQRLLAQYREHLERQAAR